MTHDDGRITVFVNTNLGKSWSRGKMAAHVAHAVLRAAGVHPGTPIVVLGAKPRDIERMRTYIRDEGRTELEPGTITAGTDYMFSDRSAIVQELRDVGKAYPDAAEHIESIIAKVEGL